MQVNKKQKRISAANLIAGYCAAVAFILLIILNAKSKEVEAIVAEAPEDPEGLFVEKVEPEKETVYIDRQVPIAERHTLYSDRLTGVVLNEEPHVAIVRNRNIGVNNTLTDHVTNDRDIIIDERGTDFIAKNDLIYENYKRTNTHDHRDIHSSNVGDIANGTLHRLDDRIGHNDNLDIGLDTDRGLLDRRIREIEEEGLTADSHSLNEGKPSDEISFENLTLAGRADEADLGDIDFDSIKEGSGKPTGGELYAYNFPRLGVGAGVGSPALGAGGGAGAGIGAGIGEAVLNGETVPTLGGIGTSPAPKGAPGSPSGSNVVPGIPGQPNAAQSPTAPSDGVGGLVSGAGAGGAAGLMVKKVSENLGLGIGEGNGAGGGYGKGGGYNYDHLPKDGALHIMMHVDGSGSILNTRKQLDIMKETLLKEALLPYYNNSEDLYNKRVTIVSSSGERTLRFFSEAAKKDNVLAIAFQDEAQPAYHLPNFNKKPEEHYLDDLGKLKASLNGYGGTYRGVMFQVDRGKTFAKSFKEFVGNALKGEGYLDSANLKKYYRDNNTHHIRNKDGIVFSDEYHAKDSGDPGYYLNLIFEASKKVGLDLNIYGAGLKDGKYNSKNKL